MRILSDSLGAQGGTPLNYRSFDLRGGGDMVVSSDEELLVKHGRDRYCAYCPIDESWRAASRKEWLSVPVADLYVASDYAWPSPPLDFWDPEAEPVSLAVEGRLDRRHGATAGSEVRATSTHHAGPGRADDPTPVQPRQTVRQVRLVQHPYLDRRASAAPLPPAPRILGRAV